LGIHKRFTAKAIGIEKRWTPAGYEQKRHNIVDKKGIPFAVLLTGANMHDSQAHNEVWSSIILKRPDAKVLLQHPCEDKAYAWEKFQIFLERRSYKVHIPKKGLDTSIVLRSKKKSAKRWVVERTGRWHNLFRRLKIRDEKKAKNYLAFIEFANAIICFRSC
jgi:putative transposase